MSQAAARIRPAGESNRDVSAVNVHLMCRVLREHGLDPVTLLRSAKLPLEILRTADRRIGWHQELVFQEHFASLTADRPDIWIETARGYTHPIFGQIGVAMITAPSLRHFRDLVIKLGIGIGQYAAVDFDQGRTGIEFTPPPRVDPAGAFYRFIIVRSVVSGVAFYNDLWQSSFPFDRVEVPLDTLPAGVKEAAPAPLVTGSTSLRWIWPASLMDVPLPRSNAVVHQEYVRRMERSRGSLAGSAPLDEQILAILGKPGNAGLSLVHVAATLTMTVRTLQRHLSENNISFSALRDEARIRQGCHLLSASDVPISEIAKLLGYVEVASFSNAFRRWTGQSPSQFRSRRGRVSGRRLTAPATGEVASLASSSQLSVP